MGKSPLQGRLVSFLRQLGFQDLYVPDLRFCAPDIRQACLFKKEFLFSVLGRTFLETKVERIGM